MKKSILILCSLLFCLAGFGQSRPDTSFPQLNQKIEGIIKNLTSARSDIDSLTAYTNTQTEKRAKALGECGVCEIGFKEWILIFSPIWLFIIAFFIIRKKLKGFSLREALSESELPKKTIPNPEYKSDTLNQLAANTNLAAILPTLMPPTIEVTASEEHAKSSSRYIAFITSTLTWVIVLCLSCFFIYEYIKKGTAPEFDGLTSVLIALGIGVVPYAFNKISAAVKA